MLFNFYVCHSNIGDKDDVEISFLEHRNTRCRAYQDRDHVTPVHARPSY